MYYAFLCEIIFKKICHPQVKKIQQVTAKSELQFRNEKQQKLLPQAKKIKLAHNWYFWREKRGFYSNFCSGEGLSALGGGGPFGLRGA